jgi:cell division protein FtsI (penicillin-binding protein 3)
VNLKKQPISSGVTPESYSWNQRRMWFFQTALVGLFFVIIGRLGQIQIIESQKYREIARKQYQSKIILPAERGLLYDCNSNVIASNSSLISYAADPQIAAEDARAIAAKFSRFFGKPKNYYLEKLQSDLRFVWLERQVDSKYLRDINPQKDTGIVIRYEPKRLYFHDNIAGQLIGTTNIDNIGLAGIEQEFDKQLRGIDGYVIFQRDGLGHARPSVDYPRVEPIHGHNIYLTIDMKIQAFAEKELKKGVEQNKAERGLVVILHSKTGEVLALAQYPNIDPNNFGKYDLQDQRLRAVTDLFEPGSIFKIVTASAALESGVVSPDKQFYAENGTYVVHVTPTKTRTIVDTHKEGWITFKEAMEKSSNIVMAKVSDLIGAEQFYKMARNFGFGISTNLDYPGEVKGVLKKPMEWSATTLNTMAFGYEVGASPIQIAAAYAAIANDGILMKPYIFKKETETSGLVIKESQPQQIRRVVSSKTAHTLIDLFEGVVERGTGTPAKIPGIRIAGKTGTSKKFVEGHYEGGNYIASFVGFFPVDNPEIVCLVMLDNPRGSSYYGGTTSAPVFKTIAEQIMNATELVPIQRKFVSDTTKRIYKTKENVEIVLYPSGFIPDVRGRSVRFAVSMLRDRKIQAIVNGSGVVIDQKPEPGLPIKSGMKITLTCQPKLSASLNLN